MRTVTNVDHLDEVSLVAPEYPYLQIGNISLVLQVSPFVISEDVKGDVLTVPAYGVNRDQSLRYIGHMSLTHILILHLQYLGLEVKYFQDEETSTDFNDDAVLINLCTNKHLRELACYTP